MYQLIVHFMGMNYNDEFKCFFKNKQCKMFIRIESALMFGLIRSYTHCCSMKNSDSSVLKTEKLNNKI